MKGISAPTFDDINVRQRQMLILDVLSGGENEYIHTTRRVIIESTAKTIKLWNATQSQDGEVQLRLLQLAWL